MAHVAALDAHSLIFRAYHAASVRGAPPAPALASMLASQLSRISPTHVIAAADLPGPTFRTAIAAGYKQGRKPSPPELTAAIPVLRGLLESSGIPVHTAEGYEADDVIATFAAKLRDGHRMTVISSDRDLAALVSPAVSMLIPGRDGIITPENVSELFGVPAARIPEYKALAGDRSDNIPGVPGIGKKGAARLLAAHASVPDLAAAAESMEGRDGKLLREGLASLLTSFRLAQLRDDAPVALDAAASEWTAAKLQSLTEHAAIIAGLEA